MNRRKFLKYAGATGAVVGASALGLDYILSSRPGQVINQTATSLNQITSSPRTNNPPRFLWPPFNMKPKHIIPTPQYTVELSPNAIDDDNDPLSFTWSVDGKEVSHERILSNKLAEGDHEIDVTAFDGQSSAVSKSALTVEPDQIYPAKPLKIKYKGMNYAAARTAPEFGSTPIPTTEEMNEQLSTIQTELGCNAIIVQAGDGYEDNLVECSRMALQKGFDRVYAYVRYMNSTLDQTVEKLGALATRVRSLRETYDSFVFMIGCEFPLSISGIIPGTTWFDRVRYATEHSDWWNLVASNEPKILRKILPVVKNNYGYPVAYAAMAGEISLVPWSDPIFGEVSPQMYPQYSPSATQAWAPKELSDLKRFGKPVIASEFGCATYKGAGLWGANDLNIAEHSYDEDEQASYIDKYCNMLNKADIDGAFYYMYNDDFDKSYGLYNGKKRKKGFYMYKSYQRAA